MTVIWRQPSRKLCKIYIRPDPSTHRFLKISWQFRSPRRILWETTNSPNGIALLLSSTISFKASKQVLSRTKNVLLLRYNKWLQGHVRRDYRTVYAVKFTKRINIKTNLAVVTNSYHLAHETVIYRITHKSSIFFCKWHTVTLTLR
jgi:hypothetical protein